MKSSSLLRIAFASLLSLGLSPASLAYSPIDFEVATAIPKLQTLTSTLSLTKGPASIDLQFAYNLNNAGFSCANGSLVNGQTVICSGTQKNNTFSLSISNPLTREKITLKGATDSPTVKASYRGLLGKLTANIVNADIGFSSAPISSNVTVTPTVDSKGKMTGTGLIVSGYGVSHANAVLTGKASLKRKTVSWSFKYAYDKLSFSGKELQGAWTGKLSGRIGPAKISQTISIPLPAAASRFHGTVTGSNTSMSTPLEEVSVVIRSDLDDSGTITGSESKTVITDADGKFDTQFDTSANRPVTVDFNLQGYSQTPKMFPGITPGTDVPLSTSLRKLDALTLTGNNAATEDNKLQLDNLPATISGLDGKVFNPVNEASQFPGEFADNTGNLLISSVFSNIQAQDDQGNKVSELATETELRMQVPPETWNTMRDLTPDNGQIDVPLYYYDEADGQWKRSNSDGWLENDARVKLVESDLATVKNGSFTGPLFAVGNITHLSYWNIDWPIDTHQCVCGRIVDDQGNPVAGAIVTAKGVSYSGSSAPVTTGADGKFCIDVMRSEAANEDLDENGVTGEQQSISLTASYNGKYYQLPEASLPSTPASAPSLDCKQLGDIGLTEDKELALRSCQISGQAVYSGIWDGVDPGLATGAPLSGVDVFAFDSSMEDWWTACTKTPCNFYNKTDNNGHFVLQIPILSGLQLFGSKYSQPTPSSYQGFWGIQEQSDCPTEPVTLKLEAWGYNPP